MTRKVIYVIVDGLAYPEGRDCMGYLQGLCEADKASLYKITSSLPSVSRPLYETLLTGKSPVESGVVSNSVVRASLFPSIFSLAQEAGLITAAAAFHWFSELYNGVPYQAVRDRYTSDTALPIQHGCFYHTASYPDEYLYLDAEHLRQRVNPDFLLVHPMGVDYVGHNFGRDSAQYRNAIRMSDDYLSMLLPRWMDEGYQVLVTADHGMTNDNNHGGNTTEEREVPLYVMGDRFSHHKSATPLQTELAGSICTLLDLSHDKASCPELLLL